MIVLGELELFVGLGDISNQNPQDFCLAVTVNPSSDIFSPTFWLELRFFRSVDKQGTKVSISIFGQTMLNP